MYQFYVFRKQKNAKISLITIKRKLVLKVIKENRINLYRGISGLTYSNTEIPGLRKWSGIETPNLERNVNSLKIPLLPTTSLLPLIQAKFDVNDVLFGLKSNGMLPAFKVKGKVTKFT